MQQRALARTGRAAQREKFAARHLKVNPAQHLERALADRIGLRQRAGAQQRLVNHGRPPPMKEETTNIQHSTSNLESVVRGPFIGDSAFDVDCWVSSS